MQCIAWKEVQQKGVIPWPVAKHQVTPDEYEVVSHLAHPQENFDLEDGNDSATVSPPINAQIPFPPTESYKPPGYPQA
jgi:hypothetical protein